MITRYEELRKLSKVFTLRMKVFLCVLAFTIGVTILQPTWLIDWFSKSYAEMLTRLWLTSALVTTMIITFFANKEVVREGAKAKNTTSEWADSISAATSWNMFIFGYAMVVVFLACLPFVHLLLINLLAGIGLVALIIRFDWELLGIKELVLKDLGSHKPDLASCDEETKNAYESNLEVAKSDYQVARDILVRLDIPLLCGIVITFVVGQLVLPFVVPGGFTSTGMDPYACGFTSGATALQLLVGNVALETIRAA